MPGRIQLTVVPPTSMTNAISFGPSIFSKLAKKLAPLIELVGPLEKVRIGNSAACSQLINVPSLDVSQSGQARLRDAIDFWNPDTVRSAKRRSEALRMAAFSLWSRPKSSVGSHAILVR